jgi:hypothetical protein
MMHVCRKLLELIGVNPERLRLEWVSASEGSRFAQVANNFTSELKALGPLGTGEGLDENGLKLKLEAVKNLVPYYNEFFTSEEVDRLFKELIGDKLEISQIMALLRERPRSTGEISEILGVDPSEASKHLGRSARQGLVRFDDGQKRFVPA